MRRGKGNIRAQKMRSKHRRKFKKCYYRNDNRHAYGLLHECKFCHKFYCTNHLLPENHECSGLKKLKSTVRSAGFNAIYKRPSYVDSTKREHYEPVNVKTGKIKHIWKPNTHKVKRLFRGKLRVLTFGIIAFICSFVAFNFKDVEIFGWINTIAWLIFAFYLYRNVFHYVNSLDMANDLSMWISRIIGGIIAFFGLFISFFSYGFSTVMTGGSDPLSTGLSIVFFGLGLLGCFMLFRTKRRYPHLYVNR